MKTRFAKMLGAAVLSLSMAVGTGGALCAQTGTTTTNQGTVTTPVRTDDTAYHNNNGRGWGWLGLIGLIGLFGLVRGTSYYRRDTGVPGTTTTRP